MWIFRRLSWFSECLALFYLIYFITNCSDSIRSQKEAMCHTDIFLMTMKRLLDYLWICGCPQVLGNFSTACRLPPFRTRVAQTGVSGSGFLPPEIRGGTMIPCSAPQEGWPRWGFTLLPSRWLAWHHIIDAVRSWETLEWEDPFPPGVAGGVHFTKSHGSDEEWLTCVDVWPGICCRAADPMVSGCNAKHYFFLFISDEQICLHLKNQVCSWLEYESLWSVGCSYWELWP